MLTTYRVEYIVLEGGRQSETKVLETTKETALQQIADVMKSLEEVLATEGLALMDIMVTALYRQ
jgi:hypothetical protein